MAPAVHIRVVRVGIRILAAVAAAHTDPTEVADHAAVPVEVATTTAHKGSEDPVAALEGRFVVVGIRFLAV